MDDLVVSTRGMLLRWHGEEVSVVADAEVFPVLRLGSEVTCGTGRTSLKSGRKMSPPKDFKRARGLVAVIHVQADDDDLPYLVELGVVTDRGMGWFSPAELELVLEDAHTVVARGAV